MRLRTWLGLELAGAVDLRACFAQPVDSGVSSHGRITDLSRLEVLRMLLLLKKALLLLSCGLHQLLRNVQY